jgi:hypothetical protein
MAGRTAFEEVHHPAESDHRPDQHPHVGVEHYETAERDPPVHQPQAAPVVLAHLDAGPAGQGLPELVPSGSIFWGLFLIVLGVLLILANFEIILYEDLFRFWPAVVIAIGLKLVAESVAKSKKIN